MNGRDVVVGDANFDGTVRIRAVQSLYRYIVWVFLAGFVLCLCAYVAVLLSITAGEAMKAFVWRMRVLTFGPAELLVLILGLGMRRRRRGTRTPIGLTAFVGFVASVALCLSAMLWLEKTSFNSDWVRLQLYKPGYMRDIAAMQGSGPHIKVWQLGNTTTDGIHGTVYDIVYDSADQLTLPADERSEAWRSAAGAWANVAAYDTDSISVNVRMVDAHFYLVSIIR